MQFMKKIITAGLLGAVATSAAAADGGLYQRLAGAEVVYPEGHAITFKDGAHVQQWRADGTTVLDTQTPFIGKRKGVWSVRQGQYCADFGPQDNRRPVQWTCWNVEFPAPGQIAFVAPPGVWLAKRRVEGVFVGP